MHTRTVNDLTDVYSILEARLLEKGVEWLRAGVM